MNIVDLIQGFIIGSSLIIAIGPQNLFVINQGLKKKFVFITVIFCSLSDSILILIGINLSNILINLNPNVLNILKILGGIWILIYGINKIYNSKKNKDISQTRNSNKDIIKTLSILFLITYVNPHVYLDTVILLGSISSNFNDKFLFGLGAILSSFIFFFILGYLSKYLSKYIYSKKTWFFLDISIGSLMMGYGIYFIFF